MNNTTTIEVGDRFLAPVDQAGLGAVQPINVYEPFPWQVPFFYDASPTILLTGSAGGGKSRGALEKIHLLCLSFPHTTAVVSRKVADTLSDSVLKVLDFQVIGDDPRVRKRPSKNTYFYDNGSEIIWTGIEGPRQREGLRSIGKAGGIDLWFLEEAHQFEEEDYQEILARMRGTALPYTQIILATNPDIPLHWINQRLRLGGEARVYYSSAADNPFLPDSYRHSLAQLRGVQALRLREGKWATGSDLIYDQFINRYNDQTGAANEGNVSLGADYHPDRGAVYWAIDDGYAGERDPKTGYFKPRSGPRAILFCQHTADGALHIFHESYKVRRLAASHLADMIELSHQRGYKMPRQVVYDGAAAQLGGSLRQIGLRETGIRVKIDEGIKEVQQWLAADENGVRRLIIHPRCKFLTLELESYTRDPVTHNPIDEFNHGPDALRYLVWWLAYARPVASVDGTDVPPERLDEIRTAVDRAMRQIYARADERLAGLAQALNLRR